MEEKIVIPEGWHEVTLSQFQELQKLDREDEMYDINLVSILCNKDMDEVSNYNVHTFTNILTNLSWIGKLPENYKPIIEHEGEQYGLAKMSSFTNGQWISLETWLENPIQNYHKILSLIYRPLVTALNDDYRIVEDYDTNTSGLRADKFKELKVSDCYGALLFFSIIEKESSQTIKEYLEIMLVTEMMNRKRQIRRKTLKKFEQGKTHGIPFFTQLLKATLSKYQKSPS